jgi:hypothetical protein
MKKTLGIDNNLTIADEIEIILETKDNTNCLLDPYKVDKVVIYFVSREFTDPTVSEYSDVRVDDSLLTQYNELKKLACENPTEELIQKLDILSKKIESSKSTSKFFFKEAQPISVFGGYKCENWETEISCTPTNNMEMFPAWLNPEMVPEEVKEQVKQDNILQRIDVGRFLLDWNPFGMREGDYFICWTWQPYVAGDSISSHIFFHLDGNTQLTTAIPTHQTNQDKYEILMERYLPELFKTFVSEGDLTPYVTQELNNSVGKGFTFLENLANQIIDLLDSNSIQEQMLPVLSNLFNLELKSNDPTLWRRQIKKAIPNFKKKGTKQSLREAFGDAGYELLKITKLWQIIPKYTFQEHFEFNDAYEFKLSKLMVLPIDEDNFELWYREKDSTEWIKLNSSYVHFSNQDNLTTMSWLNNESIPIDFSVGDSIRVVYKIKEILSEQEQQYENYTRNLPLMDIRDERDQEYPPKNWNTRLIEEDDPLFSILIPVRHPFHDLLVWGKIRTEFPYSENAYNMDEYNGSTRDSLNPCDIDKNFIDPCTDCQSSMLAIDIGIEQLSNDRIKEAEKIVYEFAPFHSLIHSINYNGIINEFVKSPIEEIIALVSYFGQETMISGEAQHIFSRSIPYDEAIEIAKRNMLGSIEAATSSLSGTAKNNSIVLMSSSSSTEEDLNTSEFKNKTGIINFKSKGINSSITDEPDPFDNTNLLEILNPSINAGFYSVKNISKNKVEISSGNVTESPLSKKQFAFRISNKIHNQTVSIQQSNKYIIKNNKSIDLVNFESKILKIASLATSDFNIVSVINVLGNGKFIVEDYESEDSVPLGEGPTLLTGNVVTWSEIDSLEEFNAEIEIKQEATVDFGSYDAIENFRIGDYLFYQGNQYEIKYFKDENNLVINIENSTAYGADVSVYRRLFDNCVGQFEYEGLVLETTINHESGLPIRNGSNSIIDLIEENNLKENYLIFINNNYYTISEIDGTIIKLDGPPNDWTTTGTEIDYIIYKFNKNPISIPDRLDPPIKGHDFDYEEDPPKGLGGYVDRSGSEVINLNVKTYSTILNYMKTQKDNISEIIGQEENINYEIEYLNEENKNDQ